METCDASKCGILFWILPVRKFHSIGVVALLVLLRLCGPTYCNAIDLGEEVPNISITSAEGSTVPLMQYQGKIVYLDFWATWCAACQRSLPWMQELQEQYGDAGFQIVAVNVDEDQEEAIKFLGGSYGKLVVGYDPSGSTPEQFGVTAMPSSFLIGRDGKLVSLHSGINENQMREIGEEIQRLTSGR